MEEQKKATDPQEQELQGNVLRTPFEKIFGNSEGETDLADTPEEHEEKKDGKP